MGINLKQITPHKVSTDLSGYMTYIYGPGGAGKSTLASHMPSPLLLAFEKGYNGAGYYILERNERCSKTVKRSRSKGHV